MRSSIITGSLYNSFKPITTSIASSSRSTLPPRFCVSCNRLALRGYAKPDRSRPKNSGPQRHIVPPRENLQLPQGYTFYFNHNDYPLPPPPPMEKVYTSNVKCPHLPRKALFHYIFPPEQKGKPHEWYPTPSRNSVGFVDVATGKELMREEIPVRAMWALSGLRAMGFKRYSVGCIFGTNSLEWIEACYAIQATGGIVTPANAAYSPQELLHQLMDSTASLCYVQPELVPVLEKALSSAPPSFSIPPERILLLCTHSNKPEGSKYRSMDEIWRKQGVPRQIMGEEEKETAYLCYSSGTTGKAKGVETSHHNMTSQLQALGAVYQPLTPQDRILGMLPFSHIYGLTLLVHQPLVRGTPVFVLPKFEPTKCLEAIQKYRITWALVVPPMLIALLHHPDFDKYDLSSLKGVQTGAAPCSAELIAAFEAKFPKVKVSTGEGFGSPKESRPSCIVTQGYGLTETSPVTHVMTIDEGYQHVGKVGRLMPTFQARLVDSTTGKDVEKGERGELWVRGPSVMKGYWKNGEATKNAFAPGGWFKTGDIAEVDDEGYFSVVDRVKELIKYKGFQVPPAEVEALLLQHPKVADVGVIGIYSEEQATELPRAYVVPKGGLDSLPESDREAYKKEIIDWVAENTSNHKKLRGGVVLMDIIPKSPSGKILRKDLRSLVKAEEEAKKSGNGAKAKL